MQRPIPRAGGISERINDEVQFSSHSILMDSGRTLQEEWDLHLQSMEVLEGHFADLKKYIGDRVPIPYQKEPLTYTKGVYQEPTWVGYNSQFMTILGQLVGVNAGQYDVTFKLSDPSYVWSDGTVGEHTVSWYIRPIPIPYPVQKEPYPEFDGNLKEPIWANVTNIEVLPLGGSITSSNAGVHRISLKPSQNYCWEDGSTIDREFSWTIKRKKISLPVQIGDLTFNGQEQTPVWDDNGKEVFVTVFDGTLIGTTAGTYRVRFKPTDNTTWQDGTVEPKEAIWSISPLVLDHDVTDLDGSISDISVIFNGEDQMPQLLGYDPLLLDAYDLALANDGTVIESTVLEHRDVGLYTLKFVPKESVSWSDGSKTPFVISWTIKPKTIAVPYISYNGSTADIKVPYTSENIGPDLNDCDLVWVDADTIKGIEVKTYTAKFSLKDSGNTVWSTGGTQPKTYFWEIIKRSVTVPKVLEDTVSYNDGLMVHPVIEEYDPRFVKVTGDSAYNVGDNYEVKFELADPVNTTWEDGTTGPRYKSWSVTSLAVTIPQVTVSSYTYNGFVQGPTVANYDPSYVLIENYEAVNAGTYTLTMTLLKKGTVWEGRTNGNPITISWSIAKKQISVPTIVDISNKVYSGETYYIVIKSSDNNAYFEVNTDRYLRDTYSDATLTISGLAGKDVGTYTVIMSLVDTNNTIWNTGSSNPISTVWKITQRIVAIPTVTGTYVFNGEEQICLFNNYDELLMTMTGNKATAVGSHSATFDLKDKQNMVWSNNSIAAQTVTWYINSFKIDPAMLSIHNAAFTYDGVEHQVTSDNISGFSDIFRLAGQVKATVAGRYTAKVYFKDSATYEWSDNRASTEGVDLEWVIQKRVMQVPTITVPNTEYTYTGNQVTITADKCSFGIAEDRNFVVLKDNTGTNAGSYTVKFGIAEAHVASCTWSDNSTTDKIDTWKINKAYISSWSTNKSSVDITGSPGSYVDITVNRPGNGEVKASVSSPYISATVVNGKSNNPTVRIKDENGPVRTTVTIRIDDGDNYYSSNFSNAHYTTTCPISLDINVSDLTRKLPSAFAPDRIQEIVREGFAASIWQVGDKIPIAFNSFTLSGQGNDYIPAGMYDAVILGFNHNKDKENATVDYTMTVAVMYQHDSTTAIAFFDRSINTPYDNFAGQYYDIIYNAISETWRDIIVTTKKYDSTSARDSKIFNLSCFEVYGSEGPGKGISQDWSDGRQKQYDYFKQAAFPTTVKPQYNALGDITVHVSSRSKGKGDNNDKTVISFLTQTGYYFRSEQQDWLPYSYSDWCETALSYHTTNYATNIQTGMIPCFNIG